MSEIFFEILELAVVIIIFLFWLYSLIWSIGNPGMEQIKRDKKWVKRYVYCFLALSFLLGAPVLSGFPSVWHFPWIGNILQFLAILFVAIIWFLALLGGGDTLFQRKQNVALLREYRDFVNQSATTLKVLAGKPHQFDEFVNYFCEQANSLDSCYKRALNPAD
jgi:hypothetical protein